MILTLHRRRVVQNLTVKSLYFFMLASNAQHSKPWWLVRSHLKKNKKNAQNVFLGRFQKRPSLKGGALRSFSMEKVENILLPLMNS